MSRALALCLLVLSLAACGVAPKRLTMEQWGTPTTQHAELVKGAGEWTGTLTLYTPEGPQTVPATETVEAVGGLWIQSRFTCDFMGMPYLGTGCVGYDPSRGRYVGNWIDNVSAFFAWMEGDVDSSGRLVMRWLGPDEVTGELVEHRSETVEAGNTRTSTFYKGAGSTQKTMVIEMRRKGS